jgi:hypothetical protein
LILTPSATFGTCFGLVIQLSNFVNADYTLDDTVAAKDINTDGTINNTSSVSISYTAATINSVTLAPQSLVVANTAELLVSFNVGVFSLSSAFQIVMTFPARFSGSSSYFASGSQTCRNGTSNIATSPLCTVSLSSFVSTVTVTNLFTSTIGASDTASFFISNLRNPISTATVSGISMTIIFDNNISYEIATLTTITMAVTTARTVSSFSHTLSSTNKIGVNQVMSSLFTMTITPGVIILEG